MERHVRALANPVGTAAGLGLAGLGVGGANLAGVFTAAPYAVAGLGGAWGGARLLDKFTGNRSPAQRYTQKFLDQAIPVRPNMPVPPQPPQAQGPVAPPAAPGAPWGPRPPGPTVPQVAPRMPQGAPQVPQATQGAPAPQAAPQAAMAPTGPMASTAVPPPQVAALLRQITAMQSPAPPAAPAAPPASIRKVDGVVKQAEAPKASQEAPSGGDDGPVPFSTTLKHAKIDHRDYAVADQAAAEFSATGKPAHVVGRYRESTAFRQARERDRLLEMSKDPAFPAEDLGFQDLVSNITKVRDREDVAQLVKDVMEQYPAHGTLAHRYFHPAWAASLWTKSKSSKKSPAGHERATSTGG
jgi:hypothetical protein